MVISNNGTNTGIVVDIYGDIINDIHPEGSEVDSSAIAIHGSVKVGDPAPTINVYGNVSSKFSAGIYQAGHSTINLEDGSTVTGPSGVVVKSGTLNIGKSTVTAPGEPVEEGTSTGDGFTPTGAAIQVDSNSTYAGHIKININDDANLVSEKGDVIQAYGEKEDNLEEINISSNAKMQAAEGKKVLAVSESLNDTFTLTIDDEEVDAETLENISSYGVKEETDTTATGGETKTEDTQNPKTGDDTGLYFILAILGLTGVCVTSKKILSNN